MNNEELKELTEIAEVVEQAAKTVNPKIAYALKNIELDENKSVADAVSEKTGIPKQEVEVELKKIQNTIAEGIRQCANDAECSGRSSSLYEWNLPFRKKKSFFRRVIDRLTGNNKSVFQKVLEWFRKLFFGKKQNIFQKALKNKKLAFFAAATFIFVGGVLLFLNKVKPLVAKFFNALKWLVSLPIRAVRKVTSFFKGKREAFNSSSESSNNDIELLFEKYMYDEAFRKVYDNHLKLLYTYTVMYSHI